LHLLGLMAPGYRFRSPDRAPLMLPGGIPAGDHELLLAFFQQVISERPLPRVEVDVRTRLLESSRLYLEHVLGDRGSGGTLLVVKVRKSGVDLREVAEHPVLSAFEHMAISNVHPGGTEDLRALLALTWEVTERAQDLYDHVASRLPQVRPEAFQEIADFVRMLQNPIDVLETVNALIEVQLEDNPREEQRRRVLHGILRRLLEWRPAGELCALVGLAARGLLATERVLGADAGPILAGLKAEGLYRDGKLRQWASYLENAELWEGLFGPQRLPTDAQLTVGWHARVQEVIAWTGRSAAGAPEGDPLRPEVMQVYQALAEGKIARALERLTEIERRLEGAKVPVATLVDYLDVRGRVLRAEGALSQAESSLREAARIAEAGSVPPARRGIVLHTLGVTLRERGELSEAEAMLREALRLSEEGGVAAVRRGITLHELGQTLRERGALEEAEATLREALRLKEEGGDTPRGRGITMGELGRTLRERGAHEEAEATLREALRLKEEGGDTPRSRGATMHNLGVVLRERGKYAEAEAALREALRLELLGGDGPRLRGRTMHELGRTLRDWGKQAEAEATLREALRLEEEGGEAPTGRAATLYALGKTLWLGGRREEAAAALEEALRLLDEAGGAVEGRGVVAELLSAVRGEGP
jgi:hypothetical protein